VSASSSPDQRLLHHLTHTANAAGHRVHDVEREVRNFVDHEAEVRPSITDNSQASFTRAVELRGALSTIDMKPIASFGPTASMILSPIIISIMPDCTMYMQLPGSPLLNTTVPAANVRFGPAPRERAHIDVRALGLWAHGRSTTP
jgi:hypothetical protein